MAKRRASEPERQPHPNLLVTRTEAAEKIRAQIEKGHELGNINIHSHESLDKARADKTRWVVNNLRFQVTLSRIMLFLIADAPE